MKGFLSKVRRGSTDGVTDANGDGPKADVAVPVKKERKYVSPLYIFFCPYFFVP